MAGIQSAGDFELVEAEIITSSGLVIDLSAAIINITFFEDTSMTAITGDILLQDSVAITSMGPIIGQEYLKLKLRTPSLTQEEETIDFTENVLIVNALEARRDVSDKIQAYMLSFTTSELVKNQRKSLAH